MTTSGNLAGAAYSTVTAQSIMSNGVSTVATDAYFIPNTTTLTADKIILRGLEINAEYRPPRPKMTYGVNALTPQYNFTATYPIIQPYTGSTDVNFNPSMTVTEHVNVRKVGIQTVADSNGQFEFLDARIVSAHLNQTQFVCAEDMLNIVDDIYDRLSKQQVISVQPSSLDSMRQSVEYSQTAVNQFKEIIEKQSNNMKVLHAMFEKHLHENKLLKKRIEELEADIASL